MSQRKTLRCPPPNLAPLLGTLLAFLLMVLPGAGATGGAVPVLAPAHESVRAGAEASGSSVVNVSVSPSVLDLSAGNSTSLHVTVTPDASYDHLEAVTYQWSLSGSASEGDLSPTDQATTQLSTWYIPNATVLTVSVTVEGAVVSVGVTPFTVSASSTVTVYPPLTVGGLSVTPDPVAPGQTTTLVADLAGGVPPYRILWEFGDGSSLATTRSQASGSLQVTHSYSEGTYEPSVQIRDSIGETGTATSSQSVLVTGALAASLEVPLQSDVNSPMVLRASITGGSPPYACRWEDSQGASYVGGLQWNVTPATVGALGVSLTVTDAQGNSVAAPGATVEVRPVPSASLASLSPLVDVGTPAPLVLNLSGGVPPFNVTFVAEGEGITETGSYPQDGPYSDPTIFATPGPLDAWLKVTDGDGVSNTFSQTVAQIVTGPTVTLAVTPSDPTVGENVSVMAGLSGGVPPYSYEFLWPAGSTPVSPSTGTLGGAGTVTGTAFWQSAGGSSVSVVVEDSSHGETQSSVSLIAAQPLRASLSFLPSRTELGRPVLAELSVTGGTPPFAGTLAASDGEVDPVSLSGSGTTFLSLTPTVAGNLSVSLSLSDSQGRTWAMETGLTVLPPLGASWSVSPDPLDAGGMARGSLTPSGGLPPYQLVVSISNGQTFPWPVGSGPTEVDLPFETPGSYVVQVNLTDSLGARWERSSLITVLPDPSARILPSSNVTDVGVPMEVSLLGSGGTGGYHGFRISLGDGTAENASTVDHVYESPGTYEITGNLTDSSGVSVAAPPVLVTVRPDPEVAATELAPGSDVGRATPFASLVTLGDPPYQYQWNFGDGASSDLADPSHVYLAPGTYQVSLSVVDAAGATATSRPFNVSVAEPPTLSVSADRTAVDVGQPVTLDAISWGGSTPEAVQWSLGDGAAERGTQVTHRYSDPGTYTVEATLVDGAGATVGASLTIVVAPDLVLPPVLPGPLPGEVGVPLELSLDPEGGTGPLREIWQVPGESSVGMGETSISLLPAAAGVLNGTVTVSDATGANATVSFDLPVAPAPTLALRAIPSQPESGVPLLIQAAITGGVSPFQFQWSTSTGVSLSTVNGSLLLSPGPAGPLVVQLSLEDARGSQRTASLTLEVAPPLTIDPPPPVLAADEGVPWTPPIQVGGGVAPYQVTARLPGMGVVNLSAPLRLPTAGEMPILVQVTDADGAYASWNGTLSVSPAPLLVVVQGPPLVAVDTPTPFSAALVGGSPPASFSWASGGLVAASGASVLLSFPEPGNYTVNLSARDGAGAQESRTLEVQALADPLSLAANLTQDLGPAPLDPTVVATVRGNQGPFTLQVTVDGEVAEVAQGVPPNRSTEMVLPPLGAGLHDIRVEAVDALGRSAQVSLSVVALSALPSPVIQPDPAVAHAGASLSLTASLPANESSPWERLLVTWWGPGLKERAGATAIFEENSSGLIMDEVSVEVLTLSGSPVQNLTLPVPVEVLPGPPFALVPDVPVELASAGENVSLAVDVVDAYGNLNTSAVGNVTLDPLPGSTIAALSPLESTLQGGVARFPVTSLHVGWANYSIQGPWSAPDPVRILWQPDVDRTVLRLTGFQREGTQLVLAIQATDVYGNPLDNVTVEGITNTGAEATGSVVDGRLILSIPGGANATSVTLHGPGGATTSADLPQGGGTGASDPVIALLGAAAVGALGLFFVFRRRRRKVLPPEASPEPLATPGDRELLLDLVAHDPSSSEEEILQRAEADGLEPSRARTALDALAREGLVHREIDPEGVPRWAPTGTRPAGDPTGEVQA